MSNLPEPPLTEREQALIARAIEVEQRKRRTVQLALAVAVLILVACGGAFAWWQDKQAQERRWVEERRKDEQRLLDAERALIEVRLDTERRLKTEQARHTVAANLALASDLRKQHKFTQAAVAIEQAAQLTDSTPELLPQVKEAQRDLALVARLDDIRYRKWIWVAEANGKGDFNTRIAPAEYRKAFAEHQLNLAELDAGEATKPIAASSIKAELVAAIDDWALHEPEVAIRDKLLEVARRADPDPLTDRLRDPAVRADAAAVAKLAAAVDPSAVSPAVVLVVAQLMHRHRLDPSPLLRAALHKHPSDFELSFLLGRFQQSRNDDGAIRAYQAAAATQPNNTTVWNNLGVALQNRGDLDGAIAAFRQALELDPRFTPAYANLGNVLALKSDADGAIAAYRRALELDPQSARAHVGLGDALMRKGEFAGAIAAYKLALGIDHAAVPTHLSLGHALRASGDLASAIAVYRNAVRFDPAHARTHHALGEALRQAGDLDGAAAAFRRAAQLDPREFKHLPENPVVPIAPAPRAVDR